jgi:hypothetical protein
MGNGNLPDNVHEGDPRAPWNHPDNPWDTPQIDDAEFECFTCGFSIMGCEMRSLSWDETTVVLAGRPVQHCPACVVAWIGRADPDEELPTGMLLMPHLCGITAHGCTCAADDATDHEIDHEKETRYVH